MTKRTFYRKLAKIKDQFIWEVTPYGCLRGQSKNGDRFCPITAVYFVMSGNNWSSFNYDHAGDKLGLNENNTEYIAKNADTANIHRPGQKALLRAVGLA